MNKPRGEGAWWRSAGQRRTWVSPSGPANGVGTAGTSRYVTTGGSAPASSDPGVGSLIDGVLGDAPATAGQRTAVAAPPRPRQPIQWPPRPAQEPTEPVRRVGLWTRVGTAMRGPTGNDYTGMRTRTRVVVVLGITAAVVVAAIVTTRSLATVSSTNFASVLTAQSPVQLNFSETGTLTTIQVVPGQTVKVGQVLATIDTTVQAQAVKSDDLKLASDDQRLAALLGKSGQLQQSQAAQDLKKVQNLATSQETRGSESVAQEQSILAAAEQSVASWDEQLATDQANYNSRCKGLGQAGCAGLERTVSTDEIQKASAENHVSEAQTALTSAEGIDSTLTNLAAEEESIAQQDATVFTPQDEVFISQARDDIATDEAQLAADRAALDQGTLVSPVAGTVVAQNGQVGTLWSSSGGHVGTGSGGSALPGSGAGSGTSPTSVGVASGTLPLIIIDAAPGLEAIAQVPEDDISNIHVGQTASVTVDALGGRTYEAKVQTIEPLDVDVQGAVYYDVVLVPAGAPWTGDLLPGMTANTNSAP